MLAISTLQSEHVLVWCAGVLVCWCAGVQCRCGVCVCVCVCVCLSMSACLLPRPTLANLIQDNVCVNHLHFLRQETEPGVELPNPWVSSLISCLQLLTWTLQV
jgi:hypothetical protein